jgi:hypothetical protein
VFVSFIVSDVMVRLLASVAVDREFKPRSGQSDYEIGNFCLHDNDVAFWIK